LAFVGSWSISAISRGRTVSKRSMSILAVEVVSANVSVIPAAWLAVRAYIPNLTLPCGTMTELNPLGGTDPFDADTDGDGSRDADELATDFSPKDTDGDGKQDAVESAKDDTDLDCIVDQADRRNTTPDGATSDRLGELCPPKVGVCGAAGAALRVMCPSGLDTPVCDFAEVPDYEASETTCDAMDNDCDGTSDEGCDLLTVGLIGHWKLDNDGQDAGPHADHGTVAGAVGTADRFGNALKAMRFSTLEAICTELECQPGDLLVFETER